MAASVCGAKLCSGASFLNITLSGVNPIPSMIPCSSNFDSKVDV